MTAVPNTFAGRSGIVPAALLDANFQSLADYIDTIRNKIVVTVPIEWADGHTDRTADIQALINQVGGTQNGGKVQFLAPVSGLQYCCTHLVVPYDNVEIDMGFARFKVTLADAAGNGSPFIYVGGVRVTSFVVTGVTKGSNVITVETGAGAGLPAGTYVTIGDSHFIEPWDYGSGNPNIGPGYNVRVNMNRVKSRSVDTITLDYVIETAFDTSPYITVWTVRKNVFVHSAQITEVDPGHKFDGDVGDVANAPHITGFEGTVGCRAERLEVDGFQLHIVSLRECFGFKSIGNTGRNPFLPGLGGHGYGGRTDRCRASQFIGNTTWGCRHTVDDVQSIDTLSQGNVSNYPVGSGIATHGHGSIRFLSVDDVHNGNSTLGTIGWFVGNPSFSGDFYTRIVNPRGSGGTAHIYITCLSDYTTVEGADFGLTQSRDILVLAGADHTDIVGGRFVAGPGTTNAVYSRDKINNSDPFGITIGTLRVIGGSVFDAALAPSGYVGVEIDGVGDAVVREAFFNITATINNAVRLGLNNTPARSIIENCMASGAGAASATFRVFRAPVSTYSVQSNYDVGAARNMALAAADQMTIAHNRGVVGSSISWTGDPIAAVAAGALVYDNTPTAGLWLDRIPEKSIDLLLSKESQVVGLTGTNRNLIFATTAVANRLDQGVARFIVRLTTGDNWEVSARNDDGTSKASMMLMDRTSLKVTMNAGEFEIKGTYDGPLRAGINRLWLDALSRLRIKSSAAASDTDGKPVLTQVAVPATAVSTGAVGDFAFDATWLYVCPTANVWVRSALLTF